MNIYIYLISSWMKFLLCLRAKIPVVVPCSPMSSTEWSNGQ